jgi:Fic family protein
MIYNWQHPNWPKFEYLLDKLQVTAIAFAKELGLINGLLAGLNGELKQEAMLQILVAEAIKTSEIEGEYMSREDVMSSIKNNLGLHPYAPIKDKRAADIATLMTAVQQTVGADLTLDLIRNWHHSLMLHHLKVNAGEWRNGDSAMQIISGPYGRETVHYEAPPSVNVPSEMEGFIIWYHQAELGAKDRITKALLKTAISHLYFESIHPFEDGNGRIGRALAEYTLSQSLGMPVMLTLSKVLEKDKKKYYEQLKKAQSKLEITEWVNYFAQAILEAQIDAKELVLLTLQKAKFFDKYEGALNERQRKVINRMLSEEPRGFEGGITAKKYIAITKTSKATATRDLQQLHELGALNQIGSGRSVRYELAALTHI